MGLFFTSRALTPTLTQTLTDALTQNPATIQNVPQTAAAMANQVQTQVSGQFAWGRAFFALFFLGLVFWACIYTARDDKLVDIYKATLHFLEIVAGAVVGVITGEAVTRT